MNIIGIKGIRKNISSASDSVVVYYNFDVRRKRATILW